jgi:hypothetical protein
MEQSSSFLVQFWIPHAAIPSSWTCERHILGGVAWRDVSLIDFVDSTKNPMANQTEHAGKIPPHRVAASSKPNQTGGVWLAAAALAIDAICAQHRREPQYSLARLAFHTQAAARRAGEN